MNPWYAVQFFIDNGARGYLVLGSVFLVVTGGEALYADMRYRFTDRTLLATDLQNLAKTGIDYAEDQTTYFFSRERITVTDDPGMAPWRERLFALLNRNAGDPTTHFGLPPERSVDIGAHIEI